MPKSTPGGACAQYLLVLSVWTSAIVDRSGPHLLRHTFATRVLRARPNIRAVQELLGHAWVTTTQRYTHIEVEDLRAQVADLPANR